MRPPGSKHVSQHMSQHHNSVGSTVSVKDPKYDQTKTTIASMGHKQNREQYIKQGTSSENPDYSEAMSHEPSVQISKEKRGSTRDKNIENLEATGGKSQYKFKPINQEEG